MEQHPSLSTLSSIKALEENYKQLSSTHLRDLLADPGRNRKMKIESNDFIFDFNHEWTSFYSDGNRWSQYNYFI